MSPADIERGYNVLYAFDSVECRRCIWSLDMIVLAMCPAALDEHERTAHPRGETMRLAAIASSVVAKLPDIVRAPFVPAVDDWDLLPDADT